MIRHSMSRRDFTRLTAAAFGGVVAGSVLSGCGGSGQTNDAAVTGAGPGTASNADMNACRGLNGCEGQGAGGHNACAGQGGCATEAMHHECKGHNECKGQGGCGEMPAANACAGQGGCAVPIQNESGWEKARQKFEQRMQAEGRTFGQAPAAS